MVFDYRVQHVVEMKAHVLCDQEMFNSNESTVCCVGNVML